MKHMTLSIAFLLPLVLAASDAHALRCQNRIISRGDTAYTVTQLCGQPAQIVHTVKVLSERNRRYGHAVEIQVEHWTYDFGPHRFMRVLRFENGVLASVRTLGYGHQKVDSSLTKPPPAGRSYLSTWIGRSLRGVTV